MGAEVLGRCDLLDCWTVGLLDCWTEGLKGSCAARGGAAALRGGQFRANQVIVGCYIVLYRWI